MKRHLILFKNGTDSDDINAADGELANGVLIPGAGTGSLPPETETPEFICRFQLKDSAVTLPSSSIFLTLHSPSASPDSGRECSNQEKKLTNILLRLGDKGLGYIPLYISSKGESEEIDVAYDLMPAGICVRFTPPDFPEIISVVTLGNYLIFQTQDNVLYSLWSNSGGYSFPLPIPSPLKMEAEMQRVRISGLMTSADSLPRISVTVPVNVNMEEGVRKWLAGEDIGEIKSERDFEEIRGKIAEGVAEGYLEYEKTVRKASLSIYPYRLMSCLRCKDREEILRSDIIECSGERMDEDISLILESAMVGNGVARLILRVSLPPYNLRVHISEREKVLPQFLSEIASGWEIWIEEMKRNLRLNSNGLPETGILHPINYYDGEEMIHGRGWTLRRNETPDEESELIFHSKVAAASIYSDEMYISGLSGDILSGEEVFELSDFINSGASTLSAENCHKSEISGKTPGDWYYGTESRNEGVLQVVNGALMGISGNELMFCHSGNPFKIRGMAQIEGGGIMDIIPSMRALSSGQLGEFPLYAFCKDGIRALSPSDNGGFKSVQLISRDICIRRGGVVLSPTGVHFPTLRGVLTLEGSNIKTLISYEKLMMVSGNVTSGGIASGIINGGSGDVSVNYYYRDDTILVSRDNRIVCGLRLNDGREIDREKCGVGEWGPGRLIQHFPELYFIDDSNRFLIVSHSYIERDNEDNEEDEREDDIDKYESEEETGAKGVIMIESRPMKLGNSLRRKKIVSYRVLPEGSYIISSQLEVSDDLEHWFLMKAGNCGWSGLMAMRGWRYFRIRLVVKKGYFPLGVEFREVR
ncbi:MAG: hypothetical protein K2N03_06135 [Muribaculaceae bacterium]|nr:hypothetical protein [Muribaculaceae bacterium]